VDATVHELCSIKGVGLAKAAQIKAALEIGKRAASYPLGNKRRVLSSRDVYDVYRHYIQYFQGLKKEVFRLLMLDGKTGYSLNIQYQRAALHRASSIRERSISRPSRIQRPR